MLDLNNLSDVEMVEVCNQVESSFNEWFESQRSEQNKLLIKQCEYCFKFYHFSNFREFEIPFDEFGLPTCVYLICLGCVETLGFLEKEQ